MARACLFCGVSGTTKSGEHAYPAWTEKCVPGAGDMLVSWEADDGRVTERRAVKLDITVMICKSCNEGWMERLESRVRPTLCPLMGGSACPVPAREHHVIAWWAAKTMAVLDRTRRPFTLRRAALRHIRERREPPPGTVGIWMGAYAGSELGWKSVRHHVRFTGARSGYSSEGLLSTFRFGHVWFQTVMVSDHRLHVVVPRESGAAQIWPPTAMEIKWPPDAAGFNDVRFAELAVRMGEG